MFLKKWWSLRKKNQKKVKVDGPSTLHSVFTPVNKLVIGMYVAELDRPWLETHFKFQGFEIKTEADIQAIRDVSDYVYIDLTKNKVRRHKIENKEPDIIALLQDYPIPPKKLSAFEKEIKQSEKIYRDAGLLVSDLMERIARGEGIDTELAKLAVADCVESILRSPDAMLWLSQLKIKDEYTAHIALMFAYCLLC